MTRLNVILCFALGLMALRAAPVKATCLNCSPVSYAACLNETGYAICFDGSTKSSVHGVCPEGKVCTEQQGICMPRVTTKPTCGSCDKCIQGFSCKSRTQFEFCTGTTPNGIVLKCPDGQICNIKNLVQNGELCVKSCLAEPTCYADEALVTPAPSPTYVDICTGKGGVGVYENIYDSTCITYVYCEELNGKMNAILYTCASGYFNDGAKQCGADKPTRCA